MGAEKVEILDIANCEQCEIPQIKASLEACTGVFLTGGDQLRLCGVLSDTPAMEIIRQRVRGGQLTPSRHQCRSSSNGAPHDCWRR